MQNRDPVLETSGKVIGFYEREFHCFSNFSSFAVEWRGFLYPTSEHAYHAAKFMNNHGQAWGYGSKGANRGVVISCIQGARSAYEAFNLAHIFPELVRTDWGAVKVAVMEDIVRCKLQQNPYCKKKLLQTGDLDIVEDSPKDSFWGWGPERNGRNELGRIWMKLRTELRAES